MPVSVNKRAWLRNPDSPFAEGDFQWLFCVFCFRLPPFYNKSVTHFRPEFCSLGKDKLSGLTRLSTSYHLFPINLSQLPDDRPHEMSMCLEGHCIWAGEDRLVGSLHSLWGLPASKMPYGQTVIERYAPLHHPKMKRKKGYGEEVKHTRLLNNTSVIRGDRSQRICCPKLKQQLEIKELFYHLQTHE